MYRSNKTIVDNGVKRFHENTYLTLVYQVSSVYFFSFTNRILSIGCRHELR